MINWALMISVTLLYLKWFISITLTNVSNISGLKKTKICKNVTFDPKRGDYYGPCIYGEFCMFAHNLEELNLPQNY